MKLFTMLLAVAASCFGQVSLSNILTGSSICVPGKVANGFAAASGKLVVSCVAATPGPVGAAGPAGTSVIGPQGPAGPVGPAGTSSNTAVIQSVDNAQGSGTPSYCESSNGTFTYTCQLKNKALIGYSRGMGIKLWADVDCAGGCSVNVDNQGRKALKSSDGSKDATFKAGFHVFDFDGTVFRMAY